MKTLNVLILMLILSTTAFAQEELIPDPEFTGRPYYLEEGEMVEFERANAVFDMKTRAMGWGGGNSYYTVFGSQSPKKIRSDAMPRFFILVEGKFDVAEALVLSRAEGKTKKTKDRRRFKQGSMKTFGKARDVSDSFIYPEVKKVRDGLYEIILPSFMEPGEYAFMPMTDPNMSILSAGNNRIKLSCFSVY